ncbi:MAG TPA: MFS transporter [Gemmatimonadales bacterium]|nr:MFS transporter [Gemmatimonadales bacterium]
MAVTPSDRAPATEEPAGVDAPLRVRLAWLAALSFASGFPFGLVNETLPVYLRTHGAGLVEIGLISAVSFPWTFKFIWAPLVDRIGTRRRWIVACLGGLTLLTLVLGTVELSQLARWFWLILVLMVTLSATQDVAIDAYTIEATTTRELGIANSVRIAAYRIAMFTAGGLLIWLAGRQGWPVSFLTGAALIGALAAAALFIPEPQRTVTSAISIWEPLRALLARPGIWAVVLFALSFKIDIYAMEPMTRPFWVDRGFTLEEIGAILTPGRIIATVSGAVLGGLLTTRLGIFRGLWTLGIVQALSSLGYAAVATVPASKPLIIGAALFENFAHGLGTAAFLAFLMSVCERRYAATQFAVLSALLALSRTLAGGASGVLAENLGYGRYFFLTFLLALPAFALLPWIKGVSRSS